MEIATKIASILFAPLLNLIGKLFGSIKLSATVEDIILREPSKPDGYGGHSGGSRVLFDLLIINRKSKPIIIDSLYCQALSEEKALVERWECYNNNNYSLFAGAKEYQVIRAINVDANKASSFTIRLTTEEDLSKCDRIVLKYHIVRTREIDIWRKKGSASKQ